MPINLQTTVEGYYCQLDGRQHILIRTVNYPHLPLTTTCMADLTRRDIIKLIASNQTLNLRGVNLDEEDLNGLDLTGATLSHGSLKNVNFNNALLDGADLSYSHLIGATFEHTSMKQANFSHADLSNADFDHAVAEETTFDFAEFSDTSMNDAYIERATFNSATNTHSIQPPIMRGEIENRV